MKIGFLEIGPETKRERAARMERVALELRSKYQPLIAEDRAFEADGPPTMYPDALPNNRN